MVEPDLSELTGIFQVENFYANISLLIVDVVLNTPSSLQIIFFLFKHPIS